MRVVVERPPMYAEILERFPAAASAGVVFTWEDTIFNPSQTVLHQDLVAHEEVHSDQQAPSGPRSWWERYLADDAFRLEQELPAYRRQYDVACSFIPHRSVRQTRLRLLALDLSSPLYGSLISFEQALRKIRSR